MRLQMQRGNTESSSAVRAAGYKRHNRDFAENFEFTFSSLSAAPILPAAVIDADGTVLGIYRKLHLFRLIFQYAGK